jgi:hypothetical protein
MKKIITVCIILLVATLAFAQEQGKTPPSQEDMMKMMAMYEKLAAPGPQHAELAKLAGDWNVVSKMWMDPKQPPMETKGTSSGKMILGGRFLQTEFNGEMMGKPFIGVGIEGYDNYKQKYVMMWIDNTGTMLTTTEGTASADGKVITYLGKMDDAMMNIKDKTIKYVATIIDDKSNKFEIFDGVGTPNEIKIMEMNYTKK